MRFLIVMLALAWTGCASKRSTSAGLEMAEQSIGYAVAESYGRGAKAYPAPPPPPPPSAPRMAEAEVYYDDAPAMAMDYTGAYPPEPEATPEPEVDDGRMVHYDGYARIRTPRAEELVDGVIALAEEAGGHVESRSVTRVTVRVPVDAFDGVWKQVLGMGPVVSRSLGAEDVTAAFTDMALRLASMRATRERLAALLAQAKTEEEKLALLQQIHRLTEQIELIDAQLRSLADLAALSRVTVEAEAPQLHAGLTAALPYGMGWIDGLSAFDHGLHEAGKPVRLPVPDGFVRLDERQYHVQAADGAVVWAGTLRNDPAGDGAFWRAAVIDRIGEQLDDGAVSEVAGWSIVRFQEPGAEDPYVWHLAFRASGRDVEVLQVTYPTAEHEARYHAAVLAALKGGEA